MFLHNLLIAFRNFRRFKGTFAINLIGLSAGIACSLLIYLWVNDEVTIDKFHQKDERLFQVLENSELDGAVTTTRGTAHFIAESLDSDFPEVEHTVVTTPSAFFPTFSLSANGNHMKGTGKFASKDFFNMFSYDLSAGDKNDVLKDKSSIVISQRLAMSLFGTTSDCIGKNLDYKLFDLKRSATVSGIFKDITSRSSETFDFILPFDSFKDLMGMNGTNYNWDGPGPFNTYLTLSETASQRSFAVKISDYLKAKTTNSAHRTLLLQSYSDGYLHGNYENGVPSGGRIVYVRLFSLIALFILSIACINFMNLSTAKATLRLKEVGIKKTVGASRRTLAIQYIGESLLITFLACLIAILLVDLSISKFNIITGKEIELNLDPRTLCAVAGLIIFTGLLSGSYPALYLSGFNPVTVLKGKLDTISFGEKWTRKGLVIVQFTLSIIFIICVIVINRQIEFIQNKNLGFDRNNVLYFEAEGNVVQNPDAFLSEIEKIPGVVRASSMLGNIISASDGGSVPGTVDVQGKTMVMHSASVNYGLLETLGIELKEGHSFSRALGSDTMKVIYNEAAIEALGITDPIGKVGTNGKEIVGVVKNFHFQSLYEKVEPYCFHLEPHFAVTILVRLQPGMNAETIQRLQRFYKGFNPGFALDYRFLDSQYQAQYASENRVAGLSTYFTALAILISCLGLFGLASFTFERKKKEIGIRKVLGSSQLGIVRFLSGDFTTMIIIAIAVALPTGYLIASRWLDSFAYHIELEWWYFLAAAFAALSIGWLTVGIQTVRASRINPSVCLKEE